MSANDEQPIPIKTDRPACWPRVIDFAKAAWPMEEPTAQKCVALMEQRHQLGIEKYGVALTAGNGRKHLIDALQEQLDLIVYLQAELDERGAILDPHTGVHDPSHMSLASLFVTHLGLLPALYELAVDTYGPL